MKRKSLPMNLQFFAEPAPSNAEPGVNTASQTTQQNNSPVFDYEKLAGIIAGKQSATEDSVLKGYFKQQGLSKEEAEQAMNAYKEQKAKNQPDVEALQKQVSTSQQAMIRSQIENKALLMHQELEIDIGTVSYLMKLVNLDGVVDKTGIINDEKLKEAFNKVLQDVPQLKKTAEQPHQGFRQVGAPQQLGNPQTTSNQKTVPTKRWNRFN